MKAFSESGNTLQFVIIAVLLMITVNVFVFLGKKAFEKSSEQHLPAAEIIAQDKEEEMSYRAKVFEQLEDRKELSAPQIAQQSFLPLPYPALIADHSEEIPKAQIEVVQKEETIKSESIKPQIKAQKFQKPDTEWQKYAVKTKTKADTSNAKTPYKIVIIIDDLGLGQSSTAQINALPGPLTLAYLPYAENLYVYTKISKARGHELLIHTPMEPLNASLDVGPAPLLHGMKEAAFKNALYKIFDSFDGYVGINNHMGSKLTQDPQAMKWVMESLRDRGLLFVDSKTIHTSIAFDVAREHGLYHTQRDVFIDHEPNIEFVRNALKKLELIARHKGYAIAIGHPKPVTIAVLKEWLPTLEARGFELVPVSAVVYKSRAPKNMEMPEVELVNIEPVEAVPVSAYAPMSTAQEDKDFYEHVYKDTTLMPYTASLLDEILPSTGDNRSDESKSDLDALEERKRSVQELKDLVLSLPISAVGRLGL